ncbi:hypothetical protein AHAS_Ahas03G0127400 [Arachis hypogaea]
MNFNCFATGFSLKAMDSSDVAFVALLLWFEGGASATSRWDEPQQHGQDSTLRRK